MTLHIYGASDDLIELAGAVRDELNPPFDKPAVVFVQARRPGTAQPVQVRLGVEYADDGQWHITEIEGHGLVTITPARGEDADADEDGCPGYSDKATVRGGCAAALTPVTPAIERMKDALIAHPQLAGVDLGTDEFRALAYDLLKVLDLDEATQVLYTHFQIPGGNYLCHCEVETGSAAKFAAHQAEALHTARLGTST